MRQTRNFNANDPAAIARVEAVKKAHETMLLQKANVVGVGVGLRRRRGELAEEVVLVVMVKQKVRRAALDPDDVLPKEIEGVPVDVQEIGEIRAEN
jgi:hypothetical protein